MVLDDAPPKDVDEYIDDEFSKNVQEIMDGLEKEGKEPSGKVVEERSLAKKQHGSSKTTTKCKGTRIVSPTEQTSIPKAATRTAFFLDCFIYPFSCVVMELAVTLKSKHAFEEFTQALMAFITNTQMVDPKFVINPLSPNSKEKNISLKGEVSPNMTKMGTHTKISGNGITFKKRKEWDKEAGDGKRQTRKNKKEEFKDPTVYFSIVVSSEVDPKEIIERMTHKWARLNGSRLVVKDLQFIDSETVVSIYKVSKSNPKDVLMRELEKLLHMTQEKVEEDGLERGLYNFLMDLDVPIGKTLPDMNLDVQIAKLRGQDVSTFNKLSNRAQYA
jgi:hypothetical protein